MRIFWGRFEGGGSEGLDTQRYSVIALGDELLCEGPPVSGKPHRFWLLGVPTKLIAAALNNPKPKP